VVDSAKTAAFKKALDNFCHTARRNIHEIDKYENARNAALKYSFDDYIDLGHFLELLIEAKASSETRSAATNLLKTIRGNRRQAGYVSKLACNGDKFANSSGLSIYFPTRQGFKIYHKRYKAHTIARKLNGTISSANWLFPIWLTSNSKTSYSTIKTKTAESQPVKK